MVWQDVELNGGEKLPTGAILFFAVNFRKEKMPLIESIKVPNSGKIVLALAQC